MLAGLYVKENSFKDVNVHTLSHMIVFPYPMGDSEEFRYFPCGIRSLFKSNSPSEIRKFSIFFDRYTKSGITLTNRPNSTREIPK